MPDNTPNTTEEERNMTYTCEIPSSDDFEQKRKDLVEKMFEKDSIEMRHLRANGLYQPGDMQYDTSFYRIRRIDPYFQVEGGTEYLFFTKPDLNIIDSSGNLVSFLYQNSSIYGYNIEGINSGPATIPYFVDLYNNGYHQTFADLCKSAHSAKAGGDSGCPFVRILSNRKVSNLDVPDIVVNELETAQNMYGTRIFYPTSSMKSDEDVEFSVEFEDTQFLEVYHFFKAYDVYRQFKYNGLLAPKEVHIRTKNLHDHMSIYKFIVDTDGETILYYAKATGVYPKSISRSAFSELQDKSGLKINVTFKLSGWFEDMEPNIITDFNQLVYSWIGGGLKEYPLWDQELQAISGENLRYFYIEKRTGSKGPTEDKRLRYLLKAGI